MRIGVFGGSFDPVHLEHIHLVEHAIGSLALDKLIIVPAACPPHKKGKTLTKDNERLALCRLAFERLNKVDVSDFEILQGGTSYTYLTCRHFKSLYKNDELFFIVGTDMLRDFPTWKNPIDILKNATLAVVARAEKHGWIEEERKKFRALFDCDFAVIDYQGKDVSSTKIRVRAGAGEDVAGFVGDKLASYIKEHGLYEIAGAKDALALEKPDRKAHSLRVAEIAAKKAVMEGVSERQAIQASLFHDCAKNLPTDSPLLAGFDLAPFGQVPKPVLHQFTGAYLAQTHFGINDSEVLDAIRFHTSGKENMTTLGKIIFLADMVEEGRDFAGVEKLRALYLKKGGIDECLRLALEQTVWHLKEKGGEIYPLTEKAYYFYKEKENGK